MQILPLSHIEPKEQVKIWRKVCIVAVLANKRLEILMLLNNFSLPRAMGAYEVVKPWALFHSHYKDEMVGRLSYLYNANYCTGKMASLYWDRPPILFHFRITNQQITIAHKSLLLPPLSNLSNRCMWHNLINSLLPSDSMWWCESGSKLAQVMACCLTNPSHYLSQCWLNISEVF